MIGSIVLNCFSYRRFNKDNIFCATAYVFPLVVFFLIQLTADFFGQWNNLFMSSAVAFSLATVNASSDYQN